MCIIAEGIWGLNCEYTSMSKTISYNIFTKDLLGLYCVTKHPGIEKMFIRLAFAQDEDFLKWLKNNDKNIRPLIKQQTIINSLLLLGELRKNFPMGQPIVTSNIVKYLLSTTGRTSAISPIYIFKSILEEQPNNRILAPYLDLINIIPSIFQEHSRGEDNKEEILNDFNVMLDLYSSSKTKENIQTGNKTSVKQQRENMYYGLLNIFSEEIANAFDAAGINDIASQFRNAILAKPFQYGLSKIIKPDPLNTMQMRNVHNIVLDAWRHYESRFLDRHHHLIETKLLEMSGGISFEEYKKIRDEYEQNEKEKKYLKDISFNKRLNPNYIFLLNYFFIDFQRKLNLIF